MANIPPAAGQRVKSEGRHVPMEDIPPAAGFAQAADPLIKTEGGHVADLEATAPAQATKPLVKEESHDSRATPPTPAAAASPPPLGSAPDPNVRLAIKQVGQIRLVREVHLASAAARNPPLPRMKKVIFICGERRVERWIHGRPASRASSPPAPPPAVPAPPRASSPAPTSRGRLNRIIFGWGKYRIVQWVREPADGAPQQPPATPPRPCPPPVLVSPVPSPPPRPPSPGPGRKWTKLIVRQDGVVRVNRWVDLPNEGG